MKKLPNAPLKEVIFEIKWDLDINPDTKQQFDHGIDTAVGELKVLLKKDFPYFNRKIPAEFPVQVMNHKVVYQYWKGEETWPVMQLGPGIFTVNDTDKNYEWHDRYYPMIKTGIENLIKVYEKKLEFKLASLRYIDVVNVNDYEFDNWKNFIESNILVF